MKSTAALTAALLISGCGNSTPSDKGSEAGVNLDASAIVDGSANLDSSAGADSSTGADGGGASCGTCFVHGRWKIDNLSPCFVVSFTGDGGEVVQSLVSTILDNNMSNCPMDPTVKPMQPWSTDTLTVDCAGDYQLCVTFKAGDPANPKASDCTVAQTCAQGTYTMIGQPQSWPQLPGWISDPGQLACATRMYTTGGYSELSVVGSANGCGTVDKVFTRIGYCPVSCSVSPNDPGCVPCGPGMGDGSF